MLFILNVNMMNFKERRIIPDYKKCDILNYNELLQPFIMMICTLEYKGRMH